MGEKAVAFGCMDHGRQYNHNIQLHTAVGGNLGVQGTGSERIVLAGLFNSTANCCCPSIGRGHNLGGVLSHLYRLGNGQYNRFGLYRLDSEVAA